jgi:predicted enzyme related to lactoylglutathione lyase
MPRVIHFEIHADSTSRAATFYAEVFGWEASRVPGPVDIWTVITGEDDRPGINGTIRLREPGTEGDRMIGYVCTIDVPSIEEYATRVEFSGGTIVAPRTLIQGIGYVANCRDTEGNLFSLVEVTA